MGKIGILTFHYSNNYGAVLQCTALQNTLKQLGFNVEIVNYVPGNYNDIRITKNLGIRRNIFKCRIKDFNPITIIKKVKIKKQNNKTITKKFDKFRKQHLSLGIKVDEKTIQSILNEYDTIIVGSDQVWNPSQRDKKEYFLDFGDSFKGRKISYAADSTVEGIDEQHRDRIKKCLYDFSSISVRNNHSLKFVKSLINKDVPVVADPTILWDFNEFNGENQINHEYILAYILGSEIKGSHEEALKRIKKVYGAIPVYFIVIPTNNFNLYNCADRVFYDLAPDEWITMFRHAAFVYTDSYHGVLFSLKLHKPFLAYYSEKMRATRFLDLKYRYKLDKYIVTCVSEIDEKQSLKHIPDFVNIDKILEQDREDSISFLKEALVN